MKINIIRSIAFALTLPCLVWAQPAAQKACESLNSRAERVLGDGQSFSCRAQADGTLAVVAASDAFDRVRVAEFPAGTFQTHSVVRDASAGMSRQASVAGAHEAYRQPATPKSLVMPASFDGAVDYSGMIVLVNGPPGTMPPGTGPEGQFPSGPPGTHPPSSRQRFPSSQPPGTQPPGTQPPGTQPPSPRPSSRRPEGDDAPPPSSTPPPSRPTPVFTPRPPRPNYWNTLDWNGVTYWNSLPDDWDRDQFDNDQGRYKSRWYPYGEAFVTAAGMTSDTESSVRNFDNQTRDLAIGLRSTKVTDVKTCYYRAIYNYSWNSFEGEWVGEFQYYEPACVRSQSYGDAVERTAVVRMSGAPLQPWERETAVATFDGSDIGVRVDNPAYQYSAYRDGDMFTFQAGAKLLTPPDVNGVGAVLVSEGGALKLRVTDKWAGKYQGETLELSVKVVRDGDHWYSNAVDVADLNWRDGTQIRWSPVAPPGVNQGSFDVSIPDQGSHKYYVESWSFRRVNNHNPDNMSRISLDKVINKGSGQYVTK